MSSSTELFINWVVTVAAAGMMPIVVLLIHDKKYPDGVLGRLFLGSIFVWGFIMVAIALADAPVDVPLFPALLIVSFFGFLARHAWRYACWRITGRCVLTRANDSRPQ